MTSEFLHNPFVFSILTIIVALGMRQVLHMLVTRIVRRAVRAERFESKVDEKKREDTITGIIKTTVSVLLTITAILVILDALGANLAALATGAGVFGVVIGLGAQNTIRDVLAGMFIILENQYRIGDTVTLSGGTTGAVGASGVVEDITLRITKLRDLDGTLNIVRNGEATIITNRTLKYSGIIVDVVVNYDTDVDVVEKLMNEIGLAMAGEEAYKTHVNQPIHFYRVENFTATGPTIRAVGQVAPATQWEIAGEYRRRLLKAFQKKHIVVIPPQ